MRKNGGGGSIRASNIRNSPQLLAKLGPSCNEEFMLTRHKKKTQTAQPDAFFCGGSTFWLLFMSSGGLEHSQRLLHLSLVPYA